MVTWPRPGEDPERDDEDAAPELHLVPRDTSFEHPLDETVPKPEPVHDGDGAEIPPLGGERKPIVPEHLRTWAGIKEAWRTSTLTLPGSTSRSTRFARRPTWSWACSGADRRHRQGRPPANRLVVAVGAVLTSGPKAVAEGNSPEYRALLAVQRKTTRVRGFVVGAEAFAILLTFVLITAFAPWWAWLVVVAVAMPPLSRAGRPRHRPIVQSAVTTPLVRKISTDAIVRAYEAGGLCSTDPKKAADHLGFGSTMSRDALDKGSQVVIHLPYGGTFEQVVNAKTKIASGLDVAESQVYFTKDKKSERRHTIRVLDTDPLAEPAGRTPLLDCKQRSIWGLVPFGLDQFGQRVAFCLMWLSFLIGAQPRKGKTFTARLAALWAALDPFTDIILIDGKSSPDWSSLRYVAHRFIQGTHPTREGDPVQRALDALYEIDRHIVHVNDELKKLTVAQRCPTAS